MSYPLYIHGEEKVIQLRPEAFAMLTDGVESVTSGFAGGH